MASALGGIEVPLHVRFVIDDRTRAALVALGWTPPPEPRPETPGDPHCPKAEFHDTVYSCSCGWTSEP